MGGGGVLIHPCKTRNLLGMQMKSYRIRLILSNDKRMSNNSDEPINVRPEVNFNHVTVRHYGVGLGVEGGVVADYIVYRYTCREGDS